MSPEEILGRVESQVLEFKGPGVLEDPLAIGRAVVAMLNADGGELWIGVEEEEGRAIRLTGVAPSVAQSLHDRLIDVIEPSPTNAELTIESVPLAEKQVLLKLGAVPDAGRGPYALLRRSGRQFVVRVGARVRPLSREEIAEAFRAPRSVKVDAGAVAERTLRHLRQEAQNNAGELMWLHIRPADSNSQIEVQSTEIEDILRHAERSGNRPDGWVFENPYRAAELGQESVMFDGVEVRRDGSITFQTPLERLHWKGEPTEIYPFALLELPVSAFRLARSIYRLSSPRPRLVLADFALFGVAGWSLRPYSPDAVGHLRQRQELEEPHDLVWSKPLRFDLDELIEGPDVCAYRLAIRRTYEAFGYREDQIPREFDRETGVLSIGGS